MSLDLHEFDGFGFGLGCLVPDEFPTGFTKAEDAIPMLKLDEIRATLSGKKSLYNRREIFGPDWISNQRSTSACNGHATAGALSQAMYVKSGGKEKVLLSGADAYSQMNGNRDNGSTLAAGMKVVTSGIALASSVPYNLIFSNQIPAAAKAERARFRGLEPYAVDTEEEFATGLALGFMGVIAVHVAGNYDKLDGDGISKGGNGTGNHAVRVDDIGMLSDGTLTYDSPGSWGATWGQDGRCRFTWNRHLRTTVGNHRFWLIRSALEDPQGDTPPEIKE